MSWAKIMECVPNFSEGRDLQKIDQIVSPFRAKAGVKLLDYSNDEDHNRLVVTVVGEPEALKEAVIEAIGVAVKLIDLNQHKGQHPRMGAVDVVPFIPIKGCNMEEAIAISKEVGQRVAEAYQLPVFLYEKSASAPHRENLAAIRKGEFEGINISKKGGNAVVLGNFTIKGNTDGLKYRHHKNVTMDANCEYDTDIANFAFEREQ